MSNGKEKGKPFDIQGADGSTIQVQAGEYYFNTKARCKRMMLNSLSADARRVYACLELATMGFQQELAVTMEKGGTRPLTPGRYCEADGAFEPECSARFGRIGKRRPSQTASG